MEAIIEVYPSGGVEIKKYRTSKNAIKNTADSEISIPA